MKKVAFVLMAAVGCFAQTVLPEGTKIRVRLEQNISSATAAEGQIVELSVTDDIRVDNVVVIAEGARASGTITQAQEKRRLGRAGKLDFSIDRVKTVDNQWVPLRYTVSKKSGQSHAVSTGILTAGTALVFWPAAPVFLLRKGQDIAINRGTAFEVFTDANHTLTAAAAPAPAPSSPVQAAGAAAAVFITSPAAGAEIEIDGAFVGNTPTTVQLAPGQHRIQVTLGARTWQRTLQANPGSTVTLNATPR
jgi:hypothetical protein